ncbi:MAG: hypothetical protein AB8F26_01780 [Phycisphaerales bacterium]
MSVRMSEDDRYELAARAEAGARSNRPTHLVLIGAVILFVSVMGVAFAWRSDTKAAKSLERSTTQLTLIKDRAERLATLEAQASDPESQDLNGPIPEILSRLENLAREAGLEAIPTVPIQDNDGYQDARRVSYVYKNGRGRQQTSIRDPSLEKMLTWVSLVTERIPGMHVRHISLTPQANAWMLEVTFARFERLE